MTGSGEGRGREGLSDVFLSLFFLFSVRRHVRESVCGALLLLLLLVFLLLCAEIKKRRLSVWVGGEKGGGVPELPPHVPTTPSSSLFFLLFCPAPISKKAHEIHKPSELVCASQLLFLFLPLLLLQQKYCIFGWSHQRTNLLLQNPRIINNRVFFPIRQICGNQTNGDWTRLARKR